MTIYLHETHHVTGTAESDFEAAYRDPGGWMDLLGDGVDGRLLYYANQAHGTGPAYRVVHRHRGERRGLLGAPGHPPAVRRPARVADPGRRPPPRGARESFLPVPWSPTYDVDLATVSAEPAEHEPTLFMEDTGWPYVVLDDYIDFWERDYMPMLHRLPVEQRLLEIQACWVPAIGAGRRPEGILWQRVHDLDRLTAVLLSTEVPASQKATGRYMSEALRYRDQWESRLLRTAPGPPAAEPDGIRTLRPRAPRRPRAEPPRPPAPPRRPRRCMSTSTSSSYASPTLAARRDAPAAPRSGRARRAWRRSPSTGHGPPGRPRPEVAERRLLALVVEVRREPGRGELHRSTRLEVAGHSWP